MKRYYIIGAIAYMVAATMLIELFSPPTSTAVALRAMLSGMLQVIGIVTGFLVASYVFWVKGVIDHFEVRSKVLPDVFKAMKSAGTTRVKYKSPIRLVGTEVERDISKPYSPAWLTLKLNQRPDDDWRVMVDGYQDLQNKVMRRAYIYMFATLLAFGGLMTGYVLASGNAELVVAQTPWVANLAILGFVFSFVWVATLMRIFLRPGAGVMVWAVKREANGLFTLITPDIG